MNFKIITTYNSFGLLNSIDDKPSLIDQLGNQYWHSNGKLHRDHDKPAIILRDQTKIWCQNGFLFRANISKKYFKIIKSNKVIKQPIIIGENYQVYKSIKDNMFDIVYYGIKFSLFKNLIYIDYKSNKKIKISKKTYETIKKSNAVNLLEILKYIDNHDQKKLRNEIFIFKLMYALDSLINKINFVYEGGEFFINPKKVLLDKQKLKHSFYYKNFYLPSIKEVLDKNRTNNLFSNHGENILLTSSLMFLDLNWINLYSDPINKLELLIYKNIFYKFYLGNTLDKNNYFYNYTHPKHASLFYIMKTYIPQSQNIKHIEMFSLYIEDVSLQQVYQFNWLTKLTWKQYNNNSNSSNLLKLYIEIDANLDYILNKNTATLFIQYKVFNIEDVLNLFENITDQEKQIIIEYVSLFENNNNKSFVDLYIKNHLSSNNNFRVILLFLEKFSENYLNNSIILATTFNFKNNHIPSEYTAFYEKTYIKDLSKRNLYLVKKENIKGFKNTCESLSINRNLNNAFDKIEKIDKKL